MFVFLNVILNSRKILCSKNVVTSWKATYFYQEKTQSFLHTIHKWKKNSSFFFEDNFILKSPIFFVTSLTKFNISFFSLKLAIRQVSNFPYKQSFMR
jgi:hypothetical protein